MNALGALAWVSVASLSCASPPSIRPTAPRASTGAALPPAVRASDRAATTEPTTVADWLDQPSYQAAPLVVEVMGSWCGHCLDSLPVLQRVFDRHRAAGLRLVAFDLEFTDDRELNRARAAALKRRFQLAWDVIAIDGRPDTIELPFELPDTTTRDLPVLVFVQRDGVVRDVISGFPAPGSPAHAETVARIERLVQEILRQPGDLDRADR
jgi:thiol-disulfide isomerase/thioredoxin